MKLSKLFILVLVIAIALVVAACGTPSPEQEIQQAVEATVEQTQTDVDAIFAGVGTAITDALDKIGNLPSQQEGAEALTTDLQDIQSRLDDAISSGGEGQLETFQSLGNAFDAVITNVNNAADAASGEQQDALKELAVVLVGAKKMLADSINTMLKAEGKATVVIAELEAAEAAATTEAEAAEAAATTEAQAAEAAATAEAQAAEAEAEAANAAATAAVGDVDAAATAAVGDVDAKATEVAAEEEAVEAEETPASSD